MSNPCFIYYPDPAGTAEVIDFGEGLSDIQELPGAVVADAATAGGLPYRSHQATSLQVRIVLERFGLPGGGELERAFQALFSHLAKGGLVAFSRDRNRIWGSLLGTQANRGDVSIDATAGNPYDVWASAIVTPGVDTNDELVLESIWPEAQRDLVVFDHQAFGTVTLQDQVRYTFSQNTHVRWRDFYPVCRLPANQVGRPFCTHDHRRNFTLDITLEYCPALVEQLWASGTPTIRGTSMIGGGDSLEELLGLA